MIKEAHKIALRMSERQKIQDISSDFTIYSLEHECELSVDDDSVLVKQAMENDN